MLFLHKGHYEEELSFADNPNYSNIYSYNSDPAETNKADVLGVRVD